jgi:hypothetical protein
MDGTLAKASTFEAWKVPAKTHVQRFAPGWTFEVPNGQSARAVADYRGERIDEVINAYADDSRTSFTLRRPHTVKGTHLAFASVGIEHQTKCVLGDLATPQRYGIFRIPKGGNATLCGGTLTAAEGTYAVPNLQVGKWFATSAVAGTPNSPPRQARPKLTRGSVIVPPPASSNAPTAPTASTAPTGYWIQINSLCRGPSGIEQPPAPERWIWVDLKGNASTKADAQELASDASKRGTPCPNYPCCPP